MCESTGARVPGRVPPLRPGAIPVPPKVNCELQKKRKGEIGKGKRERETPKRAYVREVRVMRSSCSASASARQLQLRATRQQQLKQQLSGSASSPAAAAAHSRTAARLKQHEGATSAALARPRLLLDSTCLSSQRATGGERLTEEFVARGDAEQQHASPSAESGLGSELLGSLWALLDDCRAPAVAAALTSSLAAGALLFPEAASAEYVAAVDKAQAGDILLNVFGIAFTVTFALFLLRVLNKRASRATTIKLARDRLVRALRSVSPGCLTIQHQPLRDAPAPSSRVSSCAPYTRLTQLVPPPPFPLSRRTNRTHATSCLMSQSRRSTASAPPPRPWSSVSVSGISPSLWTGFSSSSRPLVRVQASRKRTRLLHTGPPFNYLSSCLQFTTRAFASQLALTMPHHFISASLSPAVSSLALQTSMP